MWAAATTWDMRRLAFLLGTMALVLIAALSPTVAAREQSAASAQAPDRPRGLALVGGSESTLIVTWHPSPGAASYTVYLDGKRLGTTAENTYTYTGLACERRYVVGVDAVDSAGANSRATSVLGKTSVCAAPSPSPAVQPTVTPSPSPSSSSSSSSEQATASASPSPAPSAVASSAPATVALASGGSTMTFGAAADARVEEAAPTTNFGTRSLIVEGGKDPDNETYMRFRVSGVSGDVQRATLRVYAVLSTADGPAVFPTAAGWDEKTITWNSRPSRTAGAAVDAGAIPPNAWFEFDVTSLVRGNGDASFALIPTSSDRTGFNSKETGHSPQLVVTSSPSGEPAGPPALPSPTPPAPAPPAGQPTVPPSQPPVPPSQPPPSPPSQPVPTPPSEPAPTAPPGPPAPPAPPSPPVSSCDKIASPGNGTAQAMVSSLTPGQTGCLRGGTYTDSSGRVLDFRTGNVRVTAYPGERAKLVGIINVPNGSDGVRLSKVDVEGTGGSNTIKVYAADFTLEDSDVTNAWRGRSCMMLGSNSAGQPALRPVIRRNRFHECGVTGSKFDHSIYAAYAVDGRITDNVFWNVSGYTLILYPNAQRTVFAHNIVDGDAPSVRGGVAFGGDTSYASRDNVIEYNVIFNARTFNISANWEGATGSGNIARSNCVWGGLQGNVSSSGFSSQNNVTADPLLVARSSRNYRLGAGSPCLGVVGYDTFARLG